MAEPITGDALLEFLAAGTRTGKLAFVKGNGEPVVVPIWFVVDDGELVFNTMNTSLKYRCLKNNPACAIAVDEEQFPYGFASLQGRATIVEMSPEELLPWATRIAARYVPEDQVEAFGRRNAVEGEVLVRFRIERSLAFSGVAD